MDEVIKCSLCGCVGHHFCTGSPPYRDDKYWYTCSNGATVDEAYAAVVKVADELGLDCDGSGSELGGSDETKV